MIPFCAQSSNFPRFRSDPFHHEANELDQHEDGANRKRVALLAWQATEDGFLCIYFPFVINLYMGSYFVICIWFDNCNLT